MIKNIIVCFHQIGPNRKEFYGEMTLQDLLTMEFISDRVFECNRDLKTGEFCQPYLINCNNNVVCETPYSEIGVLEFDPIYDVYISQYIEHCDKKELELIKKSRYFKSDELKKYIKNL